MNVGEIKTYDVANGTGIRVTVFVSGCTTAAKAVFSRRPGILITASPIRNRWRILFSVSLRSPSIRD